MSKSQSIATQLVINEIEELKRGRAEIARQAEEKNAQIDKKIAELQQLVLHGKATTGDRITDYFLAAGHIDAEISEPFRKVGKRMKGKKGQMILIIQRERKRHVFGMPGHGSESDYHLETEMFLGVLSGEDWIFDLKKRLYSLPVEAYIELERQTDKKPGPFVFSIFCGIENLGKKIFGGRDSGVALEIHVGDKEVFAYAPYQYAGGRTHRPRGWIVTFNSAARELGKDIPEAPEEKEAKEEDRKRVLSLLDEKREVRRRLASRNVVSRSEIEKIETELQGLLNRAQELGLEKEPLVQLVTKELKDTP
jgi:hypothetical protein